MALLVGCFAVAIRVTAIEKWQVECRGSCFQSLSQIMVSCGVAKRKKQLSCTCRLLTFVSGLDPGKEEGRSVALTTMFDLVNQKLEFV